MAELDRLPNGRVHWEANNEALNKYGTPMSPMLIPYWTEGDQKSMEGLYFESSLTTPFHFINASEMSKDPSNPIPGLDYHTFDMERGIEHLGVYGVSYYVAVTPEAAAKADGLPQLTKVATTAPFTIYRLPERGLVEVASHLPSVYEVEDRGLLASLTGHSTVTNEEGVAMPSFHDLSLEWYEDIDNMDRWVVADGPADWPRIETLGERPDEALQAPANAVSNVVVGDDQISFETTAVGLPHMVKISYFPNWVAEGADGPWRAAPSLMVVVPTSEHVTLEFQDTWAETSGLVLSVVGIVVLVGFAVVSLRQRSES
jgi:hypothetical protein